jgi:aerobic carbon-monoxide dehydrogenase medium subunit
MLLPDFVLLRPRTVDEAITLVDEDHLPIVGGTELLLVMKLGMARPEGLVDLSRIGALSTISVDGGELVIGAAATHARISTHPKVRAGWPLLADVARTVGNARVRAQGTIGGNLCFAEPKSDLATVLLALRARLVLHGPAGRRAMTIDDFLLGPYTTARDDSELLTQVRVPVLANVRTTYRKTQTMERPTVGVAVVARASGVTVVVGALGAIPVRTDFESVAAVDVDAVVERLEPIPDQAGSVEYKRHLAGVQVRRALEAVA